MRCLLPSSTKVIIRCNGCKNEPDQHDFILLYTAEELGLDNFSITNPKHINALQAQYDVEKNERFVITNNGKFVHRHPNCLKKLNISGEGCSLTMFLQLFYLSLTPSQQVNLLQFLNPDQSKVKSKMTAVGSKKLNFPAFEGFFKSVSSQVLLSLHINPQSPATSASPALKYQPSKIAPVSPIRQDPFIGQDVAELITTVGKGLEKVYMSPICSERETGSPLNVSIEIGRCCLSPQKDNFTPSPLSRSLTPAFSTPIHKLRAEMGQIPVTPISGLSIPGTPMSPMPSFENMSTLWSVRESYLDSDRSRISVEQSPEDLLQEKLEELVSCMAQVTPQLGLHQQLFTEIVACFNNGTDLIEVVERFYNQHSPQTIGSIPSIANRINPQQCEMFSAHWCNNLITTATLGTSNQLLMDRIKALENVIENMRARAISFHQTNTASHDYNNAQLQERDEKIRNLQQQLKQQEYAISHLANSSLARRPVESIQVKIGQGSTQYYEGDEDDDVPLLGSGYTLVQLDQDLGGNFQVNTTGKRCKTICSYRVLLIFCLIILVVLIVELFRFLNCSNAFGKRWNAPCPDFKH